METATEVAGAERRARQEVRQAIEDSIREDRIVHLAAAPEIIAALTATCEDYAEVDAVTEYWGADDNGNDWRVHVRRAAGLAEGSR